MKIRKVSADRLDGPRPIRRGSTHASGSAAVQTDELADSDIGDNEAGDGRDEQAEEPLRSSRAG